MKNDLEFEKVKKVVDLANEIVTSAKGEVVYISNCKDSKGHLKGSIKFLDISEIELVNSNILMAIIDQLISDNKGIEIILIDNLSKMVSEEDIGDFIENVELISKSKDVKILFGLDREDKKTIVDFDIEKID